jgi:FMN phosphatase YigB (HAD superfamily)
VTAATSRRGGEPVHQHPAAIRADLVARRTWNTALLTELRRIRARATITIVSNAWPDIRTSMADAGLLDLADTVVLSCTPTPARPSPESRNS